MATQSQTLSELPTNELRRRRDRMAEALMRGLNGPMAWEAEQIWLTLEADYRRVAEEIARRNEPATQARLEVG